MSEADLPGRFRSSLLWYRQRRPLRDFLVRISRLFEEPTYLTFAKRLGIGEVPKRTKRRERAEPSAVEPPFPAISERRCNEEIVAHPDGRHWCDNSAGH
jgi:hypothetical protein